MRTATFNDVALFAFLILSGVWSSSGGVLGWALGLVWATLATVVYIDNRRQRRAP